MSEAGVIFTHIRSNLDHQTLHIYTYSLLQSSFVSIQAEGFSTPATAFTTTELIFDHSQKDCLHKLGLILLESAETSRLTKLDFYTALIKRPAKP